MRSTSGISGTRSPLFASAALAAGPHAAPAVQIFGGINIQFPKKRGRRDEGPMTRFATRALAAAGAALLVFLLGILAGPVRASEGDEDEPETPPAKPAAPPLAGGGASAQELANQIANPAAPVTSLQLRNIVTPWIEGTSGSADVFQFSPSTDRPLRLAAGRPDRQDHDADRRLGAGAPADGDGRHDAFRPLLVQGAVGALGGRPDLRLPDGQPARPRRREVPGRPRRGGDVHGAQGPYGGAILQAPISFAGSSDRPPVAQLIVSPTVTYTFAGGWFGGMTDYNWTVDFRTGDTTIPIGLQLGRVVRIGRLPVSISAEAGRAVVRPPGRRIPAGSSGSSSPPSSASTLARRRRRRSSCGRSPVPEAGFDASAARHRAVSRRDFVTALSAETPVLAKGRCKKSGP